MLLPIFFCTDLTELLAAVVPMVTDPVAVVCPKPRVIGEVPIVHVGMKAADAGDVTNMHELSVMVPVYPPTPVAVTVELPLAPGTRVTALAERENELASTPSTPKPVRLTVSGELLVLSVMLNKAVREPTFVGVKVTLIVQEALTARLATQLVLIAKELEPDSEMSELLIGLMVSAAVPVLVRVIVCGVADVPTAVLEKASDVGDTLATGSCVTVGAI